MPKYHDGWYSEFDARIRALETRHQHLVGEVARLKTALEYLAEAVGGTSDV